MFKDLGKGWLFWGAYGYIIGPAIDTIIPETDNKILSTIKDANQACTGINQALFVTPMVVVKGGAKFVEEKIRGMKKAAE